MKKHDVSPVLGPLVLLHCRCSVWPCSPLHFVRRCGECGVRPVPIPEYEPE